MGEWVKKTWHIIGYSSIKKKGSLLCVTPWIELKGLMLNEISQKKIEIV